MKKLLPFLFLTIIALLAGCKKEENNNEPPPVVPGPVELRENVHVIDTTLMSLDFMASDFTTGTYVFNTSGTPPPLLVNDVIVGAQGEGYIRKIISVTTNGTVVTCQTTQGTMEDVFSEASFSFNIDMNDMSTGKTSGLSYDTSNVMLYSNGPIEIRLLNGSVSFNPNWLFDFKFTADGGITNFEMSTTNSSYNATAQIQLTASQAINLFTEVDTLKRYSQLFIKYVPAGPILIPVVFRVNADWIVRSSADLDAAVSSTVNFHSAASDVNLGVKFSNDLWQGIHSISPTTTYDITSPEGEVSLGFNYAVEPVISVKLYGLAGPYASVGILTKSKGTVSLPSLDWDLHSEAWLKGTAGLRMDLDVDLAPLCIFGDGSINIHENYKDSLESTHIMFDAPTQIQYVLGNNQSGTSSQPLTNPLKVKVKNSLGLAQKGVPVYFTVASGGGSLNLTSILSDQNGFAEAQWTLGNTPGEQTLQVSAKNGSGDLLSGAPFTFSATNNAGLPIIINDTLLAVTAYGGTVGAEITGDGGSPVTERGFCYGTNNTPTINDVKIVCGSGTGSFTTDLSGFLPATGHSIRAYATNSVGTSYSDLIWFITYGYWYAGTYTLMHQGDQGSGSYNCGTQHGQQGQVYFYIDVVKKVTFARSIISGIPDVWDNFPGIITDTIFRIINQTIYTPGYNYGLQFDWLSVNTGIGIANRSNSTGWAFWQVPYNDPQECPSSPGGGQKYTYDVIVSATFLGGDPPSGLSPAEVQQMINFE